MLREPLTMIRRVLSSPLSAIGKAVPVSEQYASVPASVQPFAPRDFAETTVVSPPLSPHAASGRAYIVNAESSPPISPRAGRAGLLTSSARVGSSSVASATFRDLPAKDSEARHALQVKATLLPMRRM